MEKTSKAERTQPAVKRTKKNQKKKIEFSKLIFIGVSVVTISVVIFSCRMIYMTGDLSPLAYLIPSVFAELATATGFSPEAPCVLPTTTGRTAALAGV